MIEFVTIENKYNDNYEVLLVFENEDKRIIDHVFEFVYNRDDKSINIKPHNEEYEYVSDLTARDIVLYPMFREHLNKIINGKGLLSTMFAFKHIKANDNLEWILNEFID